MMKKVITYGTYDLFHYGHRRLLERAKALGDYLIVGVTADDFDKARGKINVQQSLMERIDAVKATGLADEIIVEEYEGQKIDDIKRLGIDIFTVGSDWKGKFDYLKAYCQVVYLDRTDGISSTEIRSQDRAIRLGLIGESEILVKFARECAYVNGVQITGILSENQDLLKRHFSQVECKAKTLDELLSHVDAVYIISHPSRHAMHAEKALSAGKHVLCESPFALNVPEFKRVMDLADARGLVLEEGIKTAYSIAYARMLLLAKSGKIGDVVSVDATCTSLGGAGSSRVWQWNSMTDWGPTALLPVFQLLGTQYKATHRMSLWDSGDRSFDIFTKIDFEYHDAVASIKVGKGVKSEGELIVSGTKGYIYVPAPWWKMDYFELRFENPRDNRRYFYQLDGEGIRYEVASFVRAIRAGRKPDIVGREISQAIVKMMV